MIIKIKPVESLGAKLDAVSVGDFSIQTGVSASANLALGLMADGEFRRADKLRDFSVSLTEEQYAQWGTDDGYAIACVLANAGLVPA